jgi:tRNA (guanosine-2'-O-)-methyltransferase
MRAAASVSLAAGIVLLPLAPLACSPPRGADAPEAALVHEKSVTPGDGVELSMACTPTGPELCFNAIDDNCNGIIDEGCGITTGVLQFTIAWGDSPADVDLVVTDPSGERVDETNRATKAGLRLDRDCPGENGCHGQNIENIFMEGLDVPRGKYTVLVRLVDAKSAPLPVKVRVSARVGNHTFGTTVSLTPDGADSVGQADGGSASVDGGSRASSARRTFSFEL